MFWKSFLRRLFLRSATKKGSRQKEIPAGKNPPRQDDTQPDSPPPFLGKKELGTDLAHNITQIKAAYGESADLVVRKMETATSPPLKLAIFFIDGLIDDYTIAETIIAPLLRPSAEPATGEISPH